MGSGWLWAALGAPGVRARQGLAAGGWHSDSGVFCLFLEKSDVVLRLYVGSTYVFMIFLENYDFLKYCTYL